MCIVSTTNNKAEYDAVIVVLVDELTHYILHLHVHLYSLLLLMKFNGVYHVHNQPPFRKYLQVKLLVHEFETIAFSHVLKTQNYYVDTIANKILD